MSHDEISKNHPGGLNDVESTEKEARMYETEDQGDGYRKSIQSSLPFSSIRRKTAQPNMQFGTKHDRLEYTASLK